MLSLVSTIAFWSSASQAATFHVELRGDQYPDSGDRITSASGFADFDIIEKFGEPAISYSIQLYGLVKQLKRDNFTLQQGKNMPVDGNILHL